MPRDARSRAQRQQQLGEVAGVPADLPCNSSGAPGGCCAAQQIYSCGVPAPLAVRSAVVSFGPSFLFPQDGDVAWRNGNHRGHVRTAVKTTRAISIDCCMQGMHAAAGRDVRERPGVGAGVRKELRRAAGISTSRVRRSQVSAAAAGGRRTPAPLPAGPSPPRSSRRAAPT
jgi:hypothetical protein